MARIEKPEAKKTTNFTKKKPAKAKTRPLQFTVPEDIYFQFKKIMAEDACDNGSEYFVEMLKNHMKAR